MSGEVIGISCFCPGMAIAGSLKVSICGFASLEFLGKDLLKNVFLRAYSDFPMNRLEYLSGIFGPQMGRFLLESLGKREVTVSNFQAAVEGSPKMWLPSFCV